LNPWRERFEIVCKNPSATTNKGKRMSETTANIGSRKHAVLAGSSLFRLPVAAEGRFER
jgi:hypothetical protein